MKLNEEEDTTNSSGESALITPNTIEPVTSDLVKAKSESVVEPKEDQRPSPEVTLRGRSKEIRKLRNRMCQSVVVVNDSDSNSESFKEQKPRWRYSVIGSPEPYETSKEEEEGAKGGTWGRRGNNNRLSSSIGPCASGLFFLFRDRRSSSSSANNIKTERDENFQNNQQDAATTAGGRKKNKLSRGISRIFKRQSQSYDLGASSGDRGVASGALAESSGRKARRSMSEVNLTRVQLLKTDQDQNDDEDDDQRLEVKRMSRSSVSVNFVADCSVQEPDLSSEEVTPTAEFEEELANMDPSKEPEEHEKVAEENQQGQESWVVVHKLKSESDGGILDADDKLTDVADDREQIMAIYEEDTDGMPSLQHNAGDGTSASSVGTNSPDIFQSHNDHKFQPFARTDIEITGEELSSGPASGSPNGGSLTLQVRRGSEPALNRLSPVHLSPPDPSKRWSAAPVIDEDVDNGRRNVHVSSVSIVESGSLYNGLRQVEGVGSDTPPNNNRTTVTIIGSHVKAGSQIDANNQYNNTSVNSDDGGLPRSASAGASTLLSTSGNRTASNGVPLRNASKSSTSLASRFSRDSNRLSMQFANDGRWADAADRALCLSLRKEPLGANASPETPQDSMPPPGAFSTPIVYGSGPSAQHDDSFPVFHRERQSVPFDSTQESNGDTEYFDDDEIPTGDAADTESRTNSSEPVLLTFKYEAEHLGIHVAPEHLPNNRNQGLIVQSVKAGSRIDRDGRLEAGDKIVEINGFSLIGVPFDQAKVLFKEGLSMPEIRLKVVKTNKKGGEDNVRNVRSVNVQNLVQKFNGAASEDANQQEEQGNQEGTEEKENMIQGHEQIVGEAKVATVSTTKKMPLQAVPLTRPASSTAVIASNTRKIGRKYEIDLQKGSQGLGFSVTTRDNPAGGNCPIYIKNILPTGAAIDDGRLRPGDRLLEVNGVEITGKGQSEVVGMLRNVPQGGIVKLVVSRQERVDLSPKLPRQIPPEKADDVQPLPWGEREMINLDIPVLDTEKAGLGISVKGKTQVGERGNMMDMGIYIKSVIHGGAASRDGRLKPNDQLLSINGVSLLNRSNQDAMETLRKTMTQDGPKPKPGFITLSISRRVLSSSAPTTDFSGCGSSASGDEMDSWGSKNISMSVDRSADDPTTTNKSAEQGNAVFLPAYSFNPQQQGHNVNYQQQQPHHYQQHQGTPQQNIYGQTFHNQSLSPAMPLNSYPVELPRNPVLDRLTGKTLNPAARTDSYYRATNETYNTTLIQSIIQSRNGREQVRGQAVTVQTMKGEIVLVEDDYSAPQKPPRRSRSSTPDDILDAPRNSASGATKVTSPVVSPTNGDPAVAYSDVTYASQTSLDDSGGFSRDAFGRQSMSEKRHASLDAKSTDTYQRNKKLREERERQRQMQAQQEKLNDHKQAEVLARERNLQDELARRGLKRPLSSSTEDHLALYGIGPESTSQSFGNGGYCTDGGDGRIVAGSSGGNFYGQRVLSTPEMTLDLDYSPPSDQHRVKARKSFGDQIVELFQQWGQSKSSTHRPENLPGLQRVNSADSLTDAAKFQQQEQQYRSPKKKPHPKDIQDPRQGKRDIGPSLGMKKSSSLESLQTMVQEITTQEDLKAGYGPPRNGPAAVRVIRGRGCNESFRQAVDRSYEAPLGELGNQMETLAEEETESCISGTTFGQTTQRMPSMPYPPEPSESDLDTIYGKTKGGKKKQSILRGLGSMFRFGRHRRSGGLSAAGLRKQQAEIERQEREELEAVEKVKARQAAEKENQRIQEQYRRLVEKQKEAESHYGTAPNMNGNINSGNYAQYGQLGSSSLRHHQLRKSMEHQSVRDRERREQEMRDVNGNQYMQQQQQQHEQQQAAHARSASYDVYNDLQRPGSRVGFADPSKYTNYTNYEELQQQLNDDKANGNLSDAQIRKMRQTVIEQRKKAILESRRHQQHYHSQRRETHKQRQERPVSNFYEYESVQAAMHNQAQQQHGSSPTRHPGGHSHSHQSPPQQQHQSRQMDPNHAIYAQQQQVVHQLQQQQQQQQKQSQQNPIYSSGPYGYIGLPNGGPNNGVTLPSPSAMMPHHQRSVSQFQAGTMPRQQLYVTGPVHPGAGGTLQPQTSQAKFAQQQPNSLPRRSQKELVMVPPQQQYHQQSVSSITATSHRHPMHQQQQQQQVIYQTQSIPGRYMMQSTGSQQQQQPSSVPPGNYRPMNSVPQSNSTSHLHSHPSNSMGPRTSSSIHHPSMSSALGSKV